MDHVARIVLLNGVGSAGKSSIAAALQAIASRPFLHIGMDAFIDMLPDTLQDHPDGFAYVPGEKDGHPSVAISTGPVGAQLLRGMRGAIAAMAAEGNDLIVDDVILGDEMEDYARLLSPFVVHRVGVLAPLDVLEARERQRGDRMIGLARWQFGRVHAGVSYDLEVDTARATPAECARIIKERFGL